MWREALAEHPDPVAAWRSIVADEAKRKAYQTARGKGGFVRVSWDEAATLVAASLIHTIQTHGPDRIFGFTPIPAMSMVCYASGARFLSLIGGVLASFYDWYCDLPPASPQMWGEQTDVPESADWYESSYMIVWGTNLPMTRTPDAHFFTEARYRGARVAAVAPDYAEYVKFADTWLPAKAGTDAALAMAMSHVILKEFYVDRQSEYFAAYAKAYTDLPFAVVLEAHAGDFTAGRFLRASDLGHTSNNAGWKTVLCDAASGRFVVPNGSIGFRWNEEGRWNLNLKDSATDAAVDPLLSFASSAERWVRVHSPLFEVKGAGTRVGVVPVREVQTPSGPVAVTTVFDLLAAHLGVRRKESDAHPQDYPSGYDDPRPYTPAWQEAITGVPAADAIRVAREFAENAEKTRGKSMIFLGAGTNHWFHSDMIYRAILNLTTLCGCQGVNGGGWAHYVGQEKVRPQSAWSQLAFGLDWRRPPRQQNGTSLWYFATDQWRYDTLDLQSMASPLTQARVPRHPADYNAIAARLGLAAVVPAVRPQPDRSGPRGRGGRRGHGRGDRRPCGGAAEDGRGALRRRRPGPPGQLPAGALPLACQPARRQLQGPRVLPETPARGGQRGAEHRKPAPAGGDRVARARPGRQARPARDPGDPHVHQRHVRRRGAARRGLVRDARPQHHRHAPLHPPLQPGRGPALGGAHQLGPVQDHRGRNSPSWPPSISGRRRIWWPARCCTTARARSPRPRCWTGARASASRCPARPCPTWRSSRGTTPTPTA